MSTDDDSDDDYENHNIIYFDCRTNLLCYGLSLIFVFVCLDDKVYVWGEGDQAGDDVLRVHHHEPRLRWQNGATGQP